MLRPVISQFLISNFPLALHVFQDPLIRFLLLPFAFLYGIGVGIRDFLYRRKLLLSVKFDLPVISVGNLAVGGAGKSPHIEYLVRLLRPYLEVGVLSRGYRRKTQGFRIVKPFSTAEDVGDEPLMFGRKFPDVFVAVNESRSLGIPQILQHQPGTQVVLLDDAFQHRSVAPGLNILLTEFSHPFTRDFLLPSGRLREWRSAYRRADFIIVTKCPPDLTLEEREKMVREINPYSHQQVFFSAYRYLQPHYIFNPNYKLELQEDMEVLLVTGIASTEHLVKYLEGKVGVVRQQEYGDHHYFEESDMEYIQKRFEALSWSKKAILTTEKDAVRLELHRAWIIEKKLPVCVLPV
ncbi:MAG: tetraacyldisaccharide 4'-kinase, partial [Bacteroidota bacterium]